MIHVPDGKGGLRAVGATGGTVVYDTALGHPDAKVSATRNGETVETVTDRKGRWELRLAPGTWTIRAPRHSGEVTVPARDRVWVGKL